ncbi:MAG: patatin-like phospholipase family protein, partial [Woeseiaceae bacterium]
SNGDLATAMRASMAVPGVLAPVVIDGHTLVDGGLVGNVPVSVIESMNVDVIIAVDVEFPLYESTEVRSALDITAQMLTILIRKETLRQISGLGEDDILVRPDLGNFGSTEFGNITQAIEPGAAAMQLHAARLDELALDEAGYAAHLEARQAALQPVETLDFVRVVDSGPLSSRMLEARLKTDPGESPDAARLAADAARLHGLQVYEQVDYRVVTEGGQTGVEFHTRPKAWGPNFLQFGIALEDDFQGETSFNLSSRLTRRGVNRLGGEWRTDLQIGTEPYLHSEFYQPLSFDSRYFIAPQLRLGQTNFNAFSGPDSIARYRVSNTGVALDVGRELGLWGEFRFGAFRGAGSARVKVGDPALPSVEFDTGGMFASFNVDTLDNAQIPLRGMRMHVDWTMSRPGFGAHDRFDLLETGVSGVWTSGRHTLNAGVKFNTSHEAENLVQNYFPLGGFLNLSGLVRGEISGPHAGVARLVYYRRSGEITPRVVEAPLYLGVSVEAGNAWQSRSEIDAGSLLFNGSLFAGMDTFFGPLFVGAGWAEGGGSNFYLSFGQSPP